MYTGKMSSLLQWEKVLKVMLTGKAVSRESLEDLKEMKDVPMYRLSSFIYHVKLAGGVVKVIKNGRKIESYQLVNIQDMAKYLENREKVFGSAKKAKINKLADLAAKPAPAKKTPAKKPAKPKKVSTDVVAVEDTKVAETVSTEVAETEVSDIVVAEVTEQAV